MYENHVGLGSGRCPSKHTSETGHNWVCTREPGHEGLCMAGRSNGTMIAHWYDPDVSATKPWVEEVNELVDDEDDEDDPEIWDDHDDEDDDASFIFTEDEWDQASDTIKAQAMVAELMNPGYKAHP